MTFRDFLEEGDYFIVASFFVTKKYFIDPSSGCSSETELSSEWQWSRCFGKTSTRRHLPNWNKIKRFTYIIVKTPSPGLISCFSFWALNVALQLLLSCKFMQRCGESAPKPPHQTTVIFSLVLQVSGILKRIMFSWKIITAVRSNSCPERDWKSLHLRVITQNKCQSCPQGK